MLHKLTFWNETPVSLHTFGIAASGFGWRTVLAVS
jgi:hypothetical protein